MNKVCPISYFFEGVYDDILAFENALVHFLAFVLTILSLSGREKVFSKKVGPHAESHFQAKSLYKLLDLPNLSKIYWRGRNYWRE